MFFVEVSIPARYIIEGDILTIPGLGLAWFIHDVFQHWRVEKFYTLQCIKHWYIGICGILDISAKYIVEDDILKIL